MFETETVKTTHEWETTDACEAPAIEALLRASPWRRLHFWGEMPPTVDTALLQSTFARMHYVEIFHYVTRPFYELCRALAQPDCEIEILGAMNLGYPDDVRALTSAMTVNKSLKRIIWSGGQPDHFFDCCKDNTTIEEVYIHSEGKNRGWIVDKIFVMPSVCHIIPYMRDPPSAETIKAAWPQSVKRREDRFPVHIFKTPDVIPYAMRRKLRALYECAGKVLPDHVIRDIEEEMKLCDLRRYYFDGWYD